MCVVRKESHTKYVGCFCSAYDIKPLQLIVLVVVAAAAYFKWERRRKRAFLKARDFLLLCSVCVMYKHWVRFAFTIVVIWCNFKRKHTTAVVEYIHTQFHYIVINEVVINKRESAGACARDGKGNIALCVHCIENTEPLLHMLQ